MQATTNATIDALAEKNHGAIDNGTVKLRSTRRTTKKPERNGTVVQARPPVEPWSCDECGTGGDNFQEMQQHVERKGHLRFTRA